MEQRVNRVYTNSQKSHKPTKHNLDPFALRIPLCPLPVHAQIQGRLELAEAVFARSEVDRRVGCRGCDNSGSPSLGRGFDADFVLCKEDLGDWGEDFGVESKVVAKVDVVAGEGDVVFDDFGREGFSHGCGKLEELPFLLTAVFGQVLEVERGGISRCRCSCS